ncbi:hypothetical protein KAJ83_06445 [Marivibrio halodurans]|uniref:Lipoprotein n=1 Tax=Marivibrio halodurans TaxID=2039722 RepID=A0A8J7RY01_9PROT|nr:hypothetical protein [Marivibrio halodurans]MBP5856640.1 hypothetical protein [Marivibrio halodurans]
MPIPFVPIPLALIAVAAFLLAACASPPPHAPELFRDDPAAHGLLALDVAAGSLRTWAIVLRAADGMPREEITFRPAEGERARTGVHAVARAVPPGTYSLARVMAVEDGRPCGAPTEAPTTRAVYAARLPDVNSTPVPIIAVAAGQALYVGRIGLRADLFACEGPSIRVETRPGRPVSAGDALALPLIDGPLLMPPGMVVLKGE